MHEPYARVQKRRMHIAPRWLSCSLESCIDGAPLGVTSPTYPPANPTSPLTVHAVALFQLGAVASQRVAWPWLSFMHKLINIAALSPAFSSGNQPE